jgi:hypothetical protein
MVGRPAAGPAVCPGVLVGEVFDFCGCSKLVVSPTTSNSDGSRLGVIRRLKVGLSEARVTPRVIDCSAYR